MSTTDCNYPEIKTVEEQIEELAYVTKLYVKYNDPYCEGEKRGIDWSLGLWSKEDMDLGKIKTETEIKEMLEEIKPLSEEWKNHFYSGCRRALEWILGIEKKL